MNHNKMSILFAGGGTGGHLWPGIATADAIADLVPRAQIHFYVPGTKVDRAILSGAPYAVYYNPMRSLPGSYRGLARFTTNFCRGWWQTFEVFRIARPDLVVGLGGYGAWSSGMWARHCNIPLVLLESNCIAGKVVRWLADYAQAIYTSGDVRGIPAEKIKATGIPIRSGLPLRQDIGHTQKTVEILVMGGSQGSSCINRAMCDALPYLTGISQKFHITHLGGGTDRESIQRQYDNHGLSACVPGFCRDMKKLYQHADFIICRAGGSTIAEITAIGLPALLIPFKKAAEGHQAINAKVLERQGAAMVLREDELDGRKLAVAIRAMSTPHKLRDMADCARALGKPYAAYEIARDILGLPESEMVECTYHATSLEGLS